MSRHAFVILLSLWCVSIAAAAPPRLKVVPAAEAGFDAEKLAEIDAIVARGLKNKQMPGAVVLVARDARIAWLKAYGEKTADAAMTIDTVFDLASLTKPIATATSVMKLVEVGHLKLAEPVATYLPEFAARGKEKITIEHLLTHQAGLIADNPLADYNDGVAKAWERIFALKPLAAPGERFIYSDVGFEVLGKLVETQSGHSLHEYSQAAFFAPLGMAETGYLPRPELRERAAPTEKRNGDWMQGEVHDPRAYKLEGVAGHAGLFSTAEDLAVFAQMLLNGGEYAGVRVLKAETVDEMFRPRDVPKAKRALGWDVRSGFSSNRGEGLSDASVGHGGFTGTVLWIDPEQKLFYVFLSNRVHPDGKGNVNKLAGEIGTAVVKAMVK
jgi:CubicO group peptidase (beta-lactamase class C family)